MEKHIIIGVHVTDRLKKVETVQKLFSDYGGHIKTRLGLHDVENASSPNGLIVLEMYGDEFVCDELADKLADIEGIDVQKMIFSH